METSNITEKVIEKMLIELLDYFNQDNYLKLKKNLKNLNWNKISKIQMQNFYTTNNKKIKDETRILDTLYMFSTITSLSDIFYKISIQEQTMSRSNIITSVIASSAILNKIPIIDAIFQDKDLRKEINFNIISQISISGYEFLINFKKVFEENENLNQIIKQKNTPSKIL